MLCVVISDKLLLAFRDYLPVSVLHGGGIACACLLLLHLHSEALLVDSISILTADELCEVEGESVSVEQAERLFPVELCLALSLQPCHGAVKERYALIESTEERVLLLLHDTPYELTLRCQLRICASHLSDKDWQELKHERLFLVEESIGITDGTA